MIKALMMLTLILFNYGLVIINFNNYFNNNSNNYNDSLIITASIIFEPKNLQLLQKYVQENKILNISEIKQLFIPEDEIDSIYNYLVKRGIKVEKILNVLVLTGTIGEITKALGGELQVFSLPDGSKFYTIIGSKIVSNAIVLATNFTSLFTSKPYLMKNLTQALAYSYIEPKDLWKAYNTSTLYSRGINGDGVNIGILAFEGNPYIREQLTLFDRRYGLPDPPLFKIVPIGAYNPNDGLSSGWALEISLDVEYAHVMAPNAGIILYVVNPNYPLPAAIAKIINDNEVAVVSQSFGIPEVYVALGYLPLSFVQAMIYEYWLGSVAGITFIAASGDAGGIGYNFFLSPYGSQLLPASIPYVLAVGGTSLYISGNESLQTGWSGQGILGSSTGGYSILFPSPPYQGLSGFRRIPDISAVGNPYTGVPVLYYDNKTYIVGGTSLSAPIVAGIIALAIQAYGRIGFINELIYLLNGTKAITKIGGISYNTPYQGELVTGLGYINAGYFITELGKLLKNKSGITKVVVLTSNSTYPLDYKIKIIANISPVPYNPPKYLNGYVYDGDKIIQQFTLTYNGSSWIGYVSIKKSGIFEIVVNYYNNFGYTYVTVGYQAVFLLPYIAVYPFRGNLPILAVIYSVNGSFTINNINITPEANLYKYDPLNNTLVYLKTINLEPTLVINITQYGIKLNRTYSIISGYLNLSNVSRFGGIYILSIPNIFGFVEFVLGIYLVPIVIPTIFTSPNSISTESGGIFYIYTLTVGNPNITIYLINNNKVLYKFTIDGIIYNGNLYYIKYVTLPKNLPSGLYTVYVNATYDNGNYISYGYGFTQIYISNTTLLVNAWTNSSVLYQNQYLTIYSRISYPNGTEVKFGSFSAIIVPSYMYYNIENLPIDFIVPLRYNGSLWIGEYKVPNSTSLGLPITGSSDVFNIYVQGISSDLIPSSFNVKFDISTLSLLPLSSPVKIVVLPLIYTNYFNGTLAYNQYIKTAVIENSNSTFINSLIENLTAINSKIILINSKVISLMNINSTIIQYNSTISESSILYINTSNSNIMNNTAVITQNLNHSLIFIEPTTTLILLTIFIIIIIVIVAIIMRKL
ncbi:MAG: protease pro-enzyme activation domain-containing protein [Sulfolobaceae archaeon]